MPDARVLELTVQSFTATQLIIKVKNISSAALQKSLSIDLSPPAYLLDNRIIEAARAAAESEDPPGVASLAGVVTGVPWSVWAGGDLTEASVSILLLNDRDQAGKKLEPIKLDAGAEFSINIPLNPNAPRGNIEFTYSYQHGNEPDSRVDGKLELKSDPSGWTPDVTFMTDQPTPTAIAPRTPVKIFWNIKDAVSGTLRGPLPGGNTELTLSDSTTSNYKLSEGSFQLVAVGPVTYILQAEVKRPDGKPNVLVVKMISLDVRAKEKYGYVEARPPRVLPFGLVEIDWAAWGVDEIIIDAGGASRKIPLTEMTLSGVRQGIGVMRITAGQPRPDQSLLETTVNLNTEIGKTLKTEASTKFSVIPWRKMLKSSFTGQPVGVAFANEQLMLVTTDGLFIARVGPNDFNPINYDLVDNVPFSRPTTPTDKPKAWLAIAALGKKFVVLRQTAQDDAQVALYNFDGKLEGLPIDLPSELRPLVKGDLTVFDLAIYSGRAYVVVEGVLPGGTVRRAFSVSFDSTPKQRNEPLLEQLVGYRLLTFDDTLYALNRNLGRMLRFSLKTNGELDQPYKAASAVSQTSGRPLSMIRQGQFVPVGRVMAVLSPNSLPSIASLASFGLQNVLNYENLMAPRDPNSVPQDLVYNPQHDRWVRSGHGIEIRPGMLCAYRGGESPRLWIVEPNGDTYTLTVGTEHLFSHDFVTRFPAKPLLPVLDKKRTFTIINDSEIQFVAMNEACIRNGLAPFSATGPVEMIKAPPTNLPTRTEQTFELKYNEAESPTVTLRFLVQKAAGVKHDYVLEVTLSDANLSISNTVFKRVAFDAQGNATVDEVLGTREQDSTANWIRILPRPLVNGMKLTVRNATPYQLWLRSPEAADQSAREKAYNGEEILIKYNSPAFSLYAHGAGELFFDVDFAMAQGLEMSSGGVKQNKRIRLRNDQATELAMESTSISDTTVPAVYECALRYRRDSNLESVFLGDGKPNKDGSSFYVPLASPTGGGRAQLVQFDANSLVPIASNALEQTSVFTPNTIAVVGDKVIAIFRKTDLSVLDNSLRLQKRVNLNQFDVVTNLKGSTENKFYMLGMKQEASGAFKYNYSYAARTLDQLVDPGDLLLSAQKGFRPGRVPGAPAWVSPSTISPMDVSLGVAAAICVEGGVIAIATKSKMILEIALDGTGREEAILIDPVDSMIFSAHAGPNNNGLMISRINPANLTEKLTVTLPSPITHMMTDTRTIVGPDLQYDRKRAVSLAVTNDGLFVSHATNIYLLDKRRLTVRQKVPVDLPCRLIQVRRMKPPGDAHPRYGTPRDCFMVWAIGSIYIGDGQNLEKFRTKLYKIGVVQ